MRPRTTTIQVTQDNDHDLWEIQVGDPGAAKPQVVSLNEDLREGLVAAIIAWARMEHLID